MVRLRALVPIPRSRRRFAVETLVALGILSIVISGVMTGLPTTHSAAQKGDVQSNAETLAPNQIEYLHSHPHQALPSAYPTVTPP